MNVRLHTPKTVKAFNMSTNFPLFEGAMGNGPDGAKISMMVCSPGNDLFTHVIVFDEIYGLSCLTTDRAAHASYAELFEQIRANPELVPDTESGFDWYISDRIEMGSLHAALWTDPSSGDQLTGSTIPYRKFLEKILPAERADRIRDASALTSPLKTQEVLSYLLTGDQLARLQAVETFPHLIDFMLDEKSPVHQAIEQRLPLVDAIKKVTPLDEKGFESFFEILKITRDFNHTERKTFINRFDLTDVVMVAGMVRTDQIPSTAEGMGHLFGSMRYANKIIKNCQIPKSTVLRSLKAVKKDQWALVEGRMKSYPEGEVRDYLNATSRALAASAVLSTALEGELHDLSRIGPAAARILSGEDVDEDEIKEVKEFSDRLMRPDMQGQHSALAAAVRQVIAQGFSLKGLRERAARWHHIQHVLQNEMMTSDVEISWKPLLSDDISKETRDGLHFRELTSSALLQRQGRRERHCVGSFTSTVMQSHYSGPMAIFSIEEPGSEVDGSDAKILSTVALTLNSWEKLPRISDHKATSNSEPCNRAILAVETLRRRIAEAGPSLVADYTASLSSHPHSVQQSIKNAIGIWGGNVFVESFTKTAFDVHREILPRSLSDLSSETLQAATLGELGVTSLANLQRNASRFDLKDAKLEARLSETGNVLRSFDYDAVSRASAVLLHRQGVGRIEAFMSGCGDSGDIDDIIFSTPAGDHCDEQEVQADLERASLPGFHENLWEMLRGKITTDASHEGNWYDNEGGTAEVRYIVRPGTLETEYVVVVHNEPDDDDYDEDLDEDDLGNDLIEDGMQP